MNHSVILWSSWSHLAPAEIKCFRLMGNCYVMPGSYFPKQWSHYIVIWVQMEEKRDVDASYQGREGDSDRQCLHLYGYFWRGFAPTNYDHWDYSRDGGDKYGKRLFASGCSLRAPTGRWAKGLELLGPSSYHWGETMVLMPFLTSSDGWAWLQCLDVTARMRHV